MRQHDMFQERIPGRVNVLVSGSLFGRAQLAGVRRRGRQMEGRQMRLQHLDTLGVVEGVGRIRRRLQKRVAKQTIGQVTRRVLVLGVWVELGGGDESLRGILFFLRMLIRLLLVSAVLLGS